MEQLTQTYVKTVHGSRPPLASNRATDEGRLDRKERPIRSHMSTK